MHVDAIHHHGTCDGTRGNGTNGTRGAGNGTGGAGGTRDGRIDDHAQARRVRVQKGATFTRWRTASAADHEPRF